MTTILQLSDTHLVSRGKTVSNRLDSGQSLEQFVARLMAAMPRWGQIDAIVVTGDISDDGSADSYQLFKSLVAPLGLPVFMVPGNHDNRESMRTAFLNDGYMPDSGPLNWVQQVAELTVIGLDSLVQGNGYGVLLPETLSFLEQALHSSHSGPVVVALHHPPFLTGIRFMDAIGLRNRDEFSQIIANASGEIRVICGHIHSMTVCSIAGQVVVSCPSTCSSFELDIRADAAVGFYDRPDGCLLHRWGAGFTTHCIGSHSGAGPFPF